MDKAYRRVTKKQCADFLSHCSFQGGTFDDPASYRRLGERLLQNDTRLKTCTNKLFHLAVPPKYYETILTQLSKSGLTIPCGGADEWTRILVEKPFGKDLMSAQKLDKLLGKLYREEQIFRIDHYLAKQTLQNILAFRFSNTIFEPIWNKEHIERIEIKLLEKGRVFERGSFYDANGALRDVGQNHVLQMLALITMDDPGKLDADAIRKARASILSSLEPIKPSQLKERVKRAQYKGFREEQDVSSSSRTETYFNIEARLHNKRWKGVPFVLEAGKAMEKDEASITVFFKEKQTCVCELNPAQHLQNAIKFNIKPHEGIMVRFWAKQPGLTMEVEPRELSFDYRKSKTRHAHDAYEQVLIDCVRGEQSLFASTKEVEAAWRFITPILQNWHSVKLESY